MGVMRDQTKNGDKNMKTTIRELREILFNVKDQNLTVGELRNILFDCKNQDDQMETFFHGKN